MTVRDAHGHTHRVEIPPGHRWVRTGALIPGDRYLDLVKLSNGDICWRSVNRYYLTAATGTPYGTAEWYACLIRLQHLG